MWIYFTFLAASMQACRNALQSQLGKHVSIAGVVFARFSIAAPISVVYLIVIYMVWPPEDTFSLTRKFVAYVFGASVMQITATALMVRLFKLRSFAIGVGLAKSEAIFATILGIIFFGLNLSASGWAGVLIGGVAVFIMSRKNILGGFSPETLLVGLGWAAAPHLRLHHYGSAKQA